MTTPLRLRPYEHSRDLERCLGIWRAASENAHAFLGSDQIRSDEEIVRERYMPMADITVADTDVETAGFIALLDGFIGGLFVSPDHHRLGIGKQLVEDAASRKGELNVEVYRENTQALAFYAALGFRELSERPLDDMGRPHTLVRLVREAERPQ